MARRWVGNLDDDLVRRLKKRAAEHGVSVEDEHRRILRKALDPNAGEKRKSFWQVLGEMRDTGEGALSERDRSLPGRGTEQNLFQD